MGAAGPDSTLIDACFRSSVIGVALIDPQLRYVRVNEALAAVNQRTAAEHVGQDVATMAPLIADQVLPCLQEVLRTRQPILGRQILRAQRVHGVVDVLPVPVPVDGGLLVLMVDNTALWRAERAQLARLRLSELVSEISTGFIELPPSEIGLGLTRSLRVAGEAFEIDRAFVALFAEDQKSVTIEHAWERGTTAPIERRVLAAGEHTEALQRLLGGHDLIFEALAPPGSVAPVLQAGARALLGQDSGALVAMPLRIGRSITGFVAFATRSGERAWPSDVLTSMRVSVEILASAMHRQRQEDLLADRLRFEALVAQLSREFACASIQEIDAVVVRALQLLGTARPFERVVLYRRDATDQWLELWHEWLAPGMPSMRPGYVRVPRTEVGYIPPEFYKGEAVMLDAETLPADAHLTRRIMQDRVRFVAFAPLLIAGKNLGTLALHATRRPPLPTDFTMRLTVVGELFASVIARMDAEREREQAYAELLALKGRIERERDYLREELRGGRPGDTGGILGSSEAIRATLDSIAAVAATPATVLIRGESGVGKELIARAIHDQSPRREGPLVRVNCASIPRELFESEFFGHVRGSFTGALKDRAGRFELADRGTLFLDEVGDIPLDLQAKLLRVIQEGQYERIGEDRTRTINVRLVAATNRNLEEDMAAGRFRSDLYYRLATFPLVVPPLRERGDDVLILARHFLTQYARSVGRRGLSLEPQHERQLLAYPWPGNVRELQHVIERAVILSTGEQLRLDLALPKLGAVPRAPGSSGPAPSSVSLPPPPSASSGPRPAVGEPVRMTELKRMERENILAALEKAHWRVAGAGGAAELLGLRPTTLRDRMRALGLHRER